MKKILKIILVCILVILICVLLGYIVENKFIKKEDNADNSIITHTVENKNLNITILDDEYDNNLSNRTLDKVSMTIKEGTLSKTGAIIIIKDENDSHYLYGEYYRIEKKENDEWKKLEIKDNNGTFNDVGIYPKKDGILEMTLDWEKMYGKLKKGDYRIVKEVDRNEIYAEFTIK